MYPTSTPPGAEQNTQADVFKDTKHLMHLLNIPSLIISCTLSLPPQVLIRTPSYIPLIYTLPRPPGAEQNTQADVLYPY